MTIPSNLPECPVRARRRVWLAFHALCATGILTPGLAPAQSAAAIQGVVYGLGGAPLEGAEVILVSRDRQVITDQAGRFRIGGLQTGRYSLLIRMAGYEPARLVAAVGDSALAPFEIFLAPTPYALDNIVVVGERRGIHGVVLDPELQPVPGAQVRILGGGITRQTDSTGRFAFPDKHGATYVVRVTMDGYLAQPVHLRVPTGASREVTIHLARRTPGFLAPIDQEWQYAELGVRLAQSSPVERMADGEIQRFSGMRLCDIPKIRAKLNANDWPMVVVNGSEVLRDWPLCGWLADEVALIELAVPCDSYGIVIRDPKAPRVERPPALALRPVRGITCVALWLKGWGE